MSNSKNNTIHSSFLPSNPDAPDGRSYYRETVNRANQLLADAKVNGAAFYTENREMIHRALRIKGNVDGVGYANPRGAYDDAANVDARKASREAMYQTFQQFKDSNPETKFNGNTDSFHDIE